MKKNNYLAFPIVVFFLLFASCIDEKIETEDNNFRGGSQLQLTIPGTNDVTVYSTATTSENIIEDCYVLTFDNVTGSYKNGERIDVSKITSNGSASPILPQLSFEIDNGDKVYILCNTAQTAAPSTMGISTEADVNTKFPLPKDYFFGGEALPMSGSANFASTSAAITITRAVAKIQVKLGETFNIGGFENLIEWHDYISKYFHERNCGLVVGNYSGKSDILNSPSGLSHNLSGNSAFYGTTNENKFIRFMQYATTEDSMTIYISEYPNATMDCEGNAISDNSFNEKRMFLLLIDQVEAGLSRIGNGMTANAWRLDFYDSLNKKYIDIKRNNHYTFTINKIRSTPYIYNARTNVSQINNSFRVDQEVYHNPGSNIEYTVNVDDSWAKNTFSNGQYALSVSTDTITDPSIPFHLKVQVPAGVDASKITTHEITYTSTFIGGAGSGKNLEINFNPSSSFPTDGTTTTLTFTVNDYEHLDSAGLIIRVGNIYKYIFIKISPWVFMPSPGLRAYLFEKGYLLESRSDDQRYVKLSSAGYAATTINLNREGYYATVTGGGSINVGGINVSGGFGYVPNVVSHTNISDIDTSHWEVISDLTGIEAFKNLTTLYANGNEIASLDLSQNKALESLYAESNPLTDITLDNPSLKYLDLLNSQLSSLDVSNCDPNMNVMLVTGYTSLNSGSGITISAGQGNKVTMINHSTIAAGSIIYSGPYTVTLSKEIPNRKDPQIISIEIEQVKDYSVIRKLLEEQGLSTESPVTVRHK